MSDYSTNAQVNLSLNGREVESKLLKLERKMRNLREQAMKAAELGDKGTLQRVQKEMVHVENQMRKVRTATANVEATLRNLDKATPRQLKQDIATLKAQLNGMERGSAAWDAHIAKIKALNAQLKAINAEMRKSEGGVEKFNGMVAKWQNAVAGAAAVLTGAVMAGRKAVNEFAAMDQEMASVRKYTGMTKEQVAQLNEEFKRMDTRTAREDLNRLAQEAGRLGKTDMKDVLGFVKAADVLNVALDDLGEGATLTLSKLTSIFGDEQRLGTEKALLAVGSVINELSQNSTAAAPYMAEFAKRLAGVGAQAKLTVPQVMGFAAVLDAQGQALEMSASAVSKVIMDMYKNPARIAKTAGLEVKAFTRLLKADANETLIVLLKRLNQLGNLDALAPIFKEMGSDGVRAAQVIAALAGNIGTLEWQQREAARAYREATSVTKEFDVQNNTALAGMEKARKRVHELAVELGEKLLPVMGHFMSASSFSMRTLAKVVDGMIKYRTAIISAMAAKAAWTTVMAAQNAWQKKNIAMTFIRTNATKAYTAVIRTLTAAKIALQMTMAKLEGNYVRQQSLMADARIAGLSLVKGYAAIAAAMAAVAVAGIKLWERHKEEQEQARKRRKEQEDWKRSLMDISKAAAEGAAEEKARLESLYRMATDENAARKERVDACNQLIALYPEYFGKMDTEIIMAGKAKGKYDELTRSIIESARAKAAAAKIEEHSAEILEAEMKMQQAEAWVRNARKREKEGKEKAYRKFTHGAKGNPGGLTATLVIAKEASKDVDRLEKETEMAESRFKYLQNQIRERRKAIEQLVKMPGVAEYLMNPSGGGTGVDSVDPKKWKDPKENEERRFKQEKEWKEKEEAIAKVAYAKGEIDYEQHAERMLEIAREYHQKLLQRKDLTEKERWVSEAEFYEKERELAKNVEQKRKKEREKRVQEEQEYYQEVRDIIKERYLRGETDLKLYNRAMEEAELEHLRRMRGIHPEGSKERAKADKDYREKVAQDQFRKRENYEKEKEKVKKDVFGMNKEEKDTAYRKETAMLDIVYKAELEGAQGNRKEMLRIEEAYQRARLEIARKYNQQIGGDFATKAKTAVDKTVQWLNSEGGRAVTGSMDTLVQGMAATFSAMSEVIQAELVLQEAAIERKYRKEVNMAEGNTAKVAALERQKEKELAETKRKANRKQFAMQVIQAVAQTAQGAIAAYSSAAAIPITGWLMAPVAAAMALAAGAVQIAALKKQQQASETQGYAEGGYTPKGDKYKPVGVVHAGEWVASQELLANPTAAGIIRVLDNAQRTNTIGSITGRQVSAGITAQQATARATGRSGERASGKLEDTLERLGKRLAEPFVTVNTVTGDAGIKRAQEEYDKYLRNKTKKK